MNDKLVANKANLEPFGTLLIYMAPLISIAMFAAAIWFDWSV